MFIVMVYHSGRIQTRSAQGGGTGLGEEPGLDERSDDWEQGRLLISTTDFWGEVLSPLREE